MDTIQIQKPIEEVFEGIVNPEIMTKYFISESSGPLESGKEVVWKFPEFEDRFPIKEIETETDHSMRPFEVVCHTLNRPSYRQGSLPIPPNFLKPISGLLTVYMLWPGLCPFGGIRALKRHISYT